MIPLREEEDTDKNNKNYNSKEFSIWPYQWKIEQETLLSSLSAEESSEYLESLTTNLKTKNF